MASVCSGRDVCVHTYMLSNSHRSKMLCISDNVSFDYKPLPGNVFHCTLSHTNVVTLLTCVQLHHTHDFEVTKERNFNIYREPSFL